MNIDMSEFTAIFVEEATEHLVAMEAALLSLDVETVSKEELNTIFRAAHSIKGGAATFGLPAVTEVAHVLESLLDRLRAGELALTSAMVDAFLQAVDMIGLQIAQHQGSGEVSAADATAMCEKLRLLAVADKAAARPSSMPAPAFDVPELAETGEDLAFGFFDAAPAAPVVVRATAAAAATQQESSSIRVSVEKVDEIINLVGQLVITRAMLAQLATSGGKPVQDLLSFSLEQLDRNTRDLQEAAMAIRMMPISSVFNRFPRLLRDLAGRLGKQVDLRLIGESTELDKGLIEKIADPLTHLVRNSLDHGIELPHERIAAGKPAAGTITLRASHQGGSVVIEVSDDGRGLDRERILSIARQRGVAVPENPSDTDVWGLIFEAGFSTAEQVTDVSGRGVGMDVVRSNIEALGGRVDIESTAGTGTRMTVRLPLTLAILDGLSVSCGGELFIVPLTCIIESLRPAPGTVKTVAGRGSVVHIRGEYLPVVALHEVLGIPGAVTMEQDGILIILDTEGARIALLVDALVGQHQVVIKSLETNYRKVPGISGATIMGDGRVALILDAQNIGRIASQRG